MRKNADLLRYFSELDWYLIRQHPLGWFWRAEYLLVAILSVNLIVFASAWNDPAAPLFSILVANIWIYLALDNADHIYRGNGITPLAIASFVIIQPLMLFFHGHIGQVFAWASIGLVFLYFNKLYIFAKQPAEFRPARLVFFCGATLLFAVLIASNALYNDSPSPSAQELTGPTGKLSGHVILTSYNSQTGVPHADENAPESQGVNPSQDFGLAIMAVCIVLVGGPTILFIVRRVVRYLIKPLLDIELHKRLLFGPKAEDESTKWISRIRIYSASIPIQLISFSALLAALIARESVAVALVGDTLFIAFVFLQARAFQPYMNDVRARKEIGTTNALPKREGVWW